MGACVFLFMQMWNSNNNFGEITPKLTQDFHLEGGAFLSIDKIKLISLIEAKQQLLMLTFSMSEIEIKK